MRKLFSKFKKTNTSSDMSALVPVRDPERGEVTPSISRNNSVSTLREPKIPELNSDHHLVAANGNNNTASSTSNGKPASSSILNVNNKTNKVNSELTTLNEPQVPRPAPAPVTLTKHKLMANGPRGWGRLKTKTGTNPEKESLAKQEPSRVTNDPQSEPSEPSSSIEAKSEPESRPVLSIPKLSLSSDSEAVAGPGPGGGDTNTPKLAPPEYTQMVANLMDFKVN